MNIKRSPHGGRFLLFSEQQRQSNGIVGLGHRSEVS
jgi:hypothetical protein